MRFSKNECRERSTDTAERGADLQAGLTARKRATGRKPPHKHQSRELRSVAHTAVVSGAGLNFLTHLLAALANGSTATQASISPTFSNLNNKATLPRGQLKSLRHGCNQPPASSIKIVARRRACQPAALAPGLDQVKTTELNRACRCCVWRGAAPPRPSAGCRGEWRPTRSASCRPCRRYECLWASFSHT